ncbi:MAG: hypothetical protein ACPG5L_07470 [Vibrio gallaecicus]
MTNLLLLHHDIEISAAKIDTAQVAWDSLHPIDNARGGMRGSRLKTKPVSTSASGIVDLVFTLATGQEKAASYLYIPLLKKRSVDSWKGDLTLSRSSDGTSWTDVFTTSDINLATMVGRDLVDYHKGFTETSAYQYWRIRFSGVTTGRSVNIGAPFLGVPLDLQAEWNSWDILFKDIDEPLITNASTTHLGKTGESKRIIAAEWGNVSEASMELFKDKIQKYTGKHGIILYPQVNDFITDAELFIHCKIYDIKITKNDTSNLNLISAKFEEL